MEAVVVLGLPILIGILVYVGIQLSNLELKLDTSNKLNKRLVELKVLELKKLGVDPKEIERTR